MTQKFGTGVLVIGVLFGLLTTWSSGSAPERFAESLGFKVANAGGTNEIYAQYAGFFFAVAVVCAGALLGLVPRTAAFVVLIALFGGLIAGRAASFVTNGGMNGFPPMIRALYIIDTIGLALPALALLLSRNQT